MVCNLLCHNLSNMKPQYPPNSCFYRRESSKTSINLRMNLIMFHISLIMPVWYYSSDLCLYSRLPLSAGIYPPHIYRPWLKMVKYIFPHTSLINNWFAPPHNWTRFEVGAARKSHKIVSCAVFSFTASILTPHFSPKFCAVLIKYFTSHTILRFSLYHYLYSVLASKHPPHIWSNIYAAALVDHQTPLPCLIV